MTNEFLGCLVEYFIGENGAFLDVETDLEDGGETVGEVTDAECADETGEVAEVGH